MKERIHEERLQYEAGAASIASDDTSEETLRLLEQATEAARSAMDEMSRMLYQADVSDILKSLEEVSGRSGEPHTFPMLYTNPVN